MTYPPKCWLPLPEGAIAVEGDWAEDELGEDGTNGTASVSADDEEAPDVYDETEGVDADGEVLVVALEAKLNLPPLKDAITSGKEFDLCTTRLGGILSMKKGFADGVCCPPTCGGVCGRAGCAQGGGGYKACCGGHLRKV
eukprot:SAG22_NODE_5494_length_1004_cov_0.961326_2_plen_139_part_01